MDVGSINAYPRVVEVGCARCNSIQCFPQYFTTRVVELVVGLGSKRPSVPGARSQAPCKRRNSQGSLARVISINHSGWFGASDFWTSLDSLTPSPLQVLFAARAL